MAKLSALFVAISLVAVTACAGPGAASKPSAAQPPAAAAAKAPAKAPGPYVPNGSVDGSSGTVQMQLLDSMKFQPSEINKVKAGSSVSVAMKNVGATIHNFYSPALGVNAPVRVSGGQSGTVAFTAPAQPGTYQFWCNEPGHAEAGMIGQVVVE